MVRFGARGFARRPDSAGGPAAARFALAQACALPFSATVAYLAIFGYWAHYDDEGFMMMTVRHMLDGHRLYDAVPTVYGPVYYLYEWLAHGLFRLPLTHDVVRLNATVFWLATAVVSAWIVFALTRSVVLSVAGQVLVVFHLRAVINEPGHPQEMGALLVAAIAAVAIGARDVERRRSLVVLGLLVGLLAMVKVNLGVFAGVALWMAIVSTLPMRGISAVLRVVSCAAVAVLPVVLAREKLGRGWGPFVGTEVASILAVALLSRARANAAARFDRLVVFVLACVAGIALGVLFPLLRHTSWAALVDNLIVLPSSMAASFGWSPKLATFAPAVAIVSLLLAAACAPLSSDRLRTGVGAAAVAVAKLGFAALAVRASWLDRIPWLLAWITPFLWLILLPRPRDGAGDAAGDTASFPRLALVWIAVLQPLVLYPVPGSQRWFGTFLHTVCALVAFADALAWAQAQLTLRARPAARAAVAGLVLVALASFAWGRLDGLRSHYAAMVPLRLPGAQRLRTYPQLAESLQALVAFLRHADTFLTQPGFNSLYFWTGKMPPTLDVLSHQLGLVSRQRQKAMIAALIRHPRAYVVIGPGLRRPDPWFTRRISRYFGDGTEFGKYKVLFPTYGRARR